MKSAQRVSPLFLVLGALFLHPGGVAEAQSLVSGDLSVLVTSESGERLPRSIVSVTQVSSGKRSVIAVRSDGDFLAVLLPDGVYSVTAEHVGYVPATAPSVPVSSGEVTSITLVLRAVDPPVFEIDSVDVGSSLAAADAPGATRLGLRSLVQLPGDSGTVTDVLRHQAGGPHPMASVEAAGFNEVWLDALAVPTARHPRLDRDPDLTLLPRSFVSQVSLVGHAFDVEWSGTNGSLLSTVAREGGRSVRLGGYFDWAGSALTGSNKVDLGSLSTNSLRGALTLSGPIVRDTSNFFLGVETRRVEAPRPAMWRAPPTDLAASAQATLGEDLTAYSSPLIETSEVVSAFGRFDWNFSARNRVVAQVTVSTARSDNPALESRYPNRLGSRVDGTEIIGQLHYQSGIGSSSFQELRLGFGLSEREFSAGSDIPQSDIANLGITLGNSAVGDGRFKTTDFRIREVVHLPATSHRLKVGFEGVVSTHEQDFVYGRGGVYTFGNQADFLARQGTFFQSVGSGGATNFTTSQIGLFLQDVWTVAPGLDFKLGFRMDGEFRPADNVRSNGDWRDLTRLDNSGLSSSDFKFGPRLGIEWNLDSARRWRVIGEVGRFHRRTNPGTWAELLSLDGRIVARRGTGAVGAWPGVPDSTVAPLAGPILTLGGDLEPPTSLASVIGLVRSIGRTTISVAGSYRHTDFMTRRSDLNRLPALVARDQHGRPIYADLLQSGGLVFADPGTNRRFPDFDLVSSLNQDGFMDFWGVDVQVEHEAQSGFIVGARYSFSRSTDNVIQRGFGSPYDELNPFPDSLNSGDWLEGTSDFDVPHRFVFTWQIPVPGVRALFLSGAFRFETGLPFTPGFRYGVDVNGDGSGGNDPAYVDGSIAGMDALATAWPCLAENVGQIATRNSCRSPNRSTLDLAISLGLFSFGGTRVTLYAEGLNLTDQDPFETDKALYLIDAAGTLQTDAATGVVTLPLVVNPGFGEPLVHRGGGRFFRFGLRL